MRIVFVFIILLCAVMLRSAEVIGTNALIAYTDRYDFRKIVNNRPGNGEVVTLNPPRFSWIYHLDRYPNNTVPFEFQFQCSYNSDMSSPVVNVRTEFNFFNFVDRFTSSPVYWRVGYVPSTNTLLTNWIAARSFTIAGGAIVWDRGIYTNETWLASNALIHPRLTLRSNDLLTVSNGLSSYQPFVDLRDYYLPIWTGNAKTNWFWTNAMTLSTNVHTIIQTGNVRNYETNWQRAVTFLTNGSPGFGEAVYFTDSYPIGIEITGPTGLGFGVYSNRLAWTNGGPYLGSIYQNNWETLNTVAWDCSVMGFKRLLGDTTVTNFTPEVMDYIATSFIHTPAAIQGDYYVWDLAASLAKAYDWNYPILNATQRSNVVNALALRCDWYFKNQNFGATTNNVQLGCYQIQAESHVWTSIPAIIPVVLAAYGNDARIRRMYDGVLNYIIGVGAPWGDEDGVDRGRAYTQGAMTFGGYYATAPWLFTTYFEQGWTNHPGFTEMPKWAMWFMPMGIRLNGNDTWGDGGYGAPGEATDSGDTFWAQGYGEMAAMFAHSGAVQYQHKQALAWRAVNSIYGLNNASAWYYYSTPATNLMTNTSAVFPYGGWAFGYSKPPSTYECFSNGVGFVFQARPQGGDGNHTHASDLDLEMWAYGARVMAGGGGYDSQWKAPGTSRNTISVDDLPQLTEGGSPNNSFPRDQWHSKLRAFVQGTNYVYTMGDATSNYMTLTLVSKMQRHVLFMRNKYFVIYDDIGSVSNSTYSWHWHIQEPTLSGLTDTNFSFVSSNLYAGRGAVTTLVQHVARGLGVKQVDRGPILETNGYAYNVIARDPFTSQSYANGLVSAQGTNFRHHFLTFTNTTKATNWHFMSVVYPVYAGDPVPTITRVSDSCVIVTNNVDTGDKLFFGAEADAPAQTTLIVDIGATASNPEGGGGGTAARTVTIGNVRSVGNVRTQ